MYASAAPKRASTLANLHECQRQTASQNGKSDINEFNFGNAQVPDVRQGFPGLFDLVDSAGDNLDVMAMISPVTSFLMKRQTATPIAKTATSQKFLIGDSFTQCKFQSAFPQEFYDKCTSFGGTPIHASVKLHLGEKFNLQNTLEKIRKLDHLPA